MEKTNDNKKMYILFFFKSEKDRI